MRNDETKMDKNKLLREKAEKLVLKGDALLSVNYDTLTNAGKARVIHELRVHQIELQMQNEELRRTQEQLEASQRKYFGLYNLSPVGFVTVDIEGIITEANLPFCELCSSLRRDVIGKAISHFILFEDQDVFYRHQNLLKETGLRQICELRFKTEDVQELWVRIESTPDLDESGKMESCKCAVSNITANKKAEEHIIKDNSILEEKVLQTTTELIISNNDLRSFSASVAHDLTNPLRSIDGFSQILLEEYGSVLDSEAKSMLQRIIQAAEKMHRMINSLISLTKISESVIKYVPVEMDVLVKEVFATLGKEENYKIVVDLSGLPAVPADRKLIKIVLENLLANAVKFTSNKQIREISVSGTLKGDVIEYCIKDNGVGFNMDFYEKLFKPFYRLHSDKEYEGLGIGLTIAQKIINKHGGQIWATGDVNLGSTFCFTLPIKESELKPL